MVVNKYQGFSFLIYQSPAVGDRIGLGRFVATTLRGCEFEKILLKFVAVKAWRHNYMDTFQETQSQTSVKIRQFPQRLQQYKISTLTYHAQKLRQGDEKTVIIPCVNRTGRTHRYGTKCY
jgi:hypothetical protein